MSAKIDLLIKLAVARAQNSQYITTANACSGWHSAEDWQNRHLYANQLDEAIENLKHEMTEKEICMASEFTNVPI